MPQATEHVLSDLRVLDLTRALAGPSCTRMLAEMGAEVIKVEPAPNGDMIRRISVFGNNRSLYFVQQNLGKKSLCVNLRDPRGLALLAELIPKVDVVVENFKPGVIAEMGLGYERLRELKSDIILCSISALGQSGPLADKPGYDYIAQAYSGVTSMIGEPGDALYIPLVGLGDVSTGVHAALAIVSALRYRDRTGEGQHLDIALLDVYYHFHEVNVHAYSGSGGAIQPTRAGRHMTYVCPGGVFRGKGGYLAPVLSVAETVHHPHHRQRGTVRTVHDPLHGDFDMPGMPLKFSRFPQDLPLQAATLGQHNQEILTTYLGRSPEEVQRLRAEGVVVEKNL